jgi:Zn-dependent protease with chaperone function
VTATIFLLAFALLSGFLGPHLLGRARWPSRSPRLGVAAWLVLSGSAALSGLLAVATVAVPVTVAGHGLADWWRACLGELRHYYGDTSLTVAGLAAAAAATILGRMTYAAADHVRQVARVRRHQKAVLALLPARTADLVVLSHPVPAAYCIPGRPGRVILTEGAMRALEPDQLDAVLAHERAHLTGRHAVLVGVATVLERAFGSLAPVFGRSRREVAALVEMIADDAAARACPRRRVAEALLILARGVTPTSTLAANGSDMLPRLRRLVTPPSPLGRLRTSAMLATLLLIVTMPLTAVAAPVAAAVVVATCTHAAHP